MSKPSPILYLAPLQGLTNYIFRNAFAECFSGFDLAVAPFISTTRGRKIRQSYFRDILPENNNGLPVIPQLMSNTEDDFIYFAEHLYDLGYETVNWNLGCPYAMVAKKKRGSGMLPYPDRIDRFLAEVVPRIPGRLSIKCRLGRYQDDEILKLIPVFNQYPLKELIIHPRTGIQMYDGAVNLDRFEECLSLTGHFLVYNGDIRCPEDYRRLSDRFGKVDAWMIGRGALVNPFLPALLLTEKSHIPDKQEKMKRFHDILLDGYHNYMSGPSHILDKMKGHWYYLSQAFQDQERIFKKIKKVNALEKFESIVAAVFEQEGALRI